MKFENMLNTITLGDSYKLIKDIPDNSIDLIIIDPPYEYTTGGGSGCFGTKKRTYHKEYNDIAFSKNYKNEGQKRVWEDKRKSREGIKHISSGFDLSLLNELERVMKKTNIYIWCSKAQVSKLLNYYESKDRNIDILTWHKTNPLPTMNNTYANDTEYCIFFFF